MAYDDRALARATNGQYHNSLKHSSFDSTLERQDVQRLWDPSHPERIALILQNWNTKHCFLHGMQIALFEAFSDPSTSRFALYLFSSAETLRPTEGNYCGPLPAGIWRLDVFDFSPPPAVADSPILDTEGLPGDRSGTRKFSLLSSNLDIPVVSGTSETGLSALSALI